MDANAALRRPALLVSEYLAERARHFGYSSGPWPVPQHAISALRTLVERARDEMQYDVHPCCAAHEIVADALRRTPSADGLATGELLSERLRRYEVLLETLQLVPGALDGSGDLQATAREFLAFLAALLVTAGNESAPALHPRCA